MRRRFNTQGICVLNKHYMVDITNKLNKIMKLIEDEAYFTINRPRQYGKTTTIGILEKRLAAEGYLVISTSFEGIDDKKYEDSQKFIATLLLQFRKILISHKEDELVKFIDDNSNVSAIDELGDFITELILKANRKIVLIIDEVDKSCNNQLFLNFLGMLRNKYLLRNEGKDVTFHSVVLVGVHDVKTLKLKLRPDDERKYNSPWNIAAKFKVDMSFNSEEITTMLEDYSSDRKVDMDIIKIADKIHYYTSGYPFLVSSLCEIIDTEIEPIDGWSLEDVDNAVKMLLKESNSNFDDLIKNLENNHELYKTTEDLLINGTERSFNLDNPIINLGSVYGIFKESNGKLGVHNRIYEQRIYNYMSSKMETSNVGLNNFTGSFLENGTINMEKLILKFQQFMKEQYSKKDEKFIEREGRLLLLAFIKPIINGKGFDFKEVQISEENRLDVVITYLNNKYILETKIWRGNEAHQRGIVQLKDYLNKQCVNKGYLVIFDFTNGKEKDWNHESVTIDGKEIFMVRV